MQNREHPDGGRLTERLERFGQFVRNESPTYSRICLAVAPDPTVHRILARTPYDQPPANILLAAVQYLLLADPDEPLASHYRRIAGPEASPRGDLVEQFLAFCRRHEATLTDLAASRRVQTNEVRRCVGILPALVSVAAETGQPLALIEIGPSAGFNLAVDRYGYDYGPIRVGPPNPPLVLSTQSRGATPPLDPFPSIIWRRGIDLAPVDVGDDTDVRWLRALLWPEQDDRIARFEAALEVAAAEPPVVVRGDATEQIRAVAQAAPPEAQLVIMHTFVLNQLAEGARNRLTEKIASIGRERPVFRLGIDMLRRGEEAPAIGLTRFDGEAPAFHDLGSMHHHGAWLEWAS